MARNGHSSLPWRHRLLDRSWELEMGCQNCCSRLLGPSSAAVSSAAVASNGSNGSVEPGPEPQLAREMATRHEAAKCSPRATASKSTRQRLRLRTPLAKFAPRNIMGMNMKLHEGSELTSSVGETSLKEESCEHGEPQHEQPRRAKETPCNRADRSIQRHRGKAERAPKTNARKAKQARRASRARAAEAFKRSHNERHRHNIPQRATEKETPPNLRLQMVPMVTFVHGWTMSPSPTH